MFGYDNKNDAHKQSNYAEWKKTAHVVTNVEIKVETTGISEGDLKMMFEAMANGTPFGLYNNDLKYILIFPAQNAIVDGEGMAYYNSPKQLLNAIKLLLFEFNKVYVPELNPLTNEKANNIRLRGSGGNVDF